MRIIINKDDVMAETKIYCREVTNPRKILKEDLISWVSLKMVIEYSGP